jgi:hypothetical protein
MLAFLEKLCYFFNIIREKTSYPVGLTEEGYSKEMWLWKRPS